MREFASVPACPACGLGRELATATYCTSAHIRGTTSFGVQKWIASQTHDSPHTPHLHIVCGRCKFEWLEATLSDVTPFFGANTG